MGFRNPFRIQVDENDVAYVTDYSPDSHTPAVVRGPAGTGRMRSCASRRTTAGRSATGPDLPYYRWNFNTSTPLDSPPQSTSARQPATAGAARTTRAGTSAAARPSSPACAYGPPITNPDIWYSFTPRTRPTRRSARRARRTTTARSRSRTGCPRLFPELGTGGVGPHGAAKYHYDPDNPDTTKFPPYYDGAVFFGEFTRDTAARDPAGLAEPRVQDQQPAELRSARLDRAIRRSSATTRWTCSSTGTALLPAHLRRRLLQHQHRRRHVPVGLRQGPARADAVLARDRRPTAAAADRRSSRSEGSRDPDPGDSIRFEWDFDGDGTVDSTDPNPTHTYTTGGVTPRGSR